MLPAIRNLQLYRVSAFFHAALLSKISAVSPAVTACTLLAVRLRLLRFVLPSVEVADSLLASLCCSFRLIGIGGAHAQVGSEDM